MVLPMNTHMTVLYAIFAGKYLWIYGIWVVYGYNLHDIFAKNHKDIALVSYFRKRAIMKCNRSSQSYYGHQV